LLSAVLIGRTPNGGAEIACAVFAAIPGITPTPTRSKGRTGALELTGAAD